VAAPQWVRAPLRDPLPAAGDNELIVRKGHRSMSVLCDRIGKRVLFATPGKNKSVWPRFVAEMDRQNGPPGRSRKYPSKSGRPMSPGRRITPATNR
jgi:hypothetical protein